MRQNAFPRLVEHHLSAKSVRNIHGILHRALGQALKLGMISVNPTDLCDLPKTRRKEFKPMERFHDLRHSYAVASLESGDDIKTVQANLGHATAAFTLDVYGHVTDQMKEASAQRMEGFIKGVLKL